MSTKRLGRTAVENGRPQSVKENLRLMRRRERRQARDDCRDDKDMARDRIMEARHMKRVMYGGGNLSDHHWKRLLDAYFLSLSGTLASDALARLVRKHRSNSYQDRLLRMKAKEAIKHDDEFYHTEAFRIDADGIIREPLPHSSSDR